MPDRPHGGDEPAGEPSGPEDFELPLPSQPRRVPGDGTPSWLDLLPSGDRVMLPRPRRSGRNGRRPAETGRPPGGNRETPAEVTHDDRTTS